MNKLKNVFQRSSQKIKTTEDRRPQQFVKRHSTAMVTPITTPVNSNESPLPPPAIDLSDLSEMEKPAYQSWWKDLDPFDLQKINNQTILKFLNGCSLPDNKLEQILALFETAGDGLNKLQFFAMLRLIAHAQNGRKISRALVYLGAPIPLFHTNAIDALIKTDIPQRRLGNSPKESDMQQQQDIEEKLEKDEQPAELRQSNSINHHTNRKSWWGNEKEQLAENRRSYMGPFTAHTPIPNSPFNQSGDNSMMDYFYALPPINNNNTNINNTTNNNQPKVPTPYNTFSPNTMNQPWPPSEDNEIPNSNILISTSMIRPVLTNSVTTTATITPVTPNIVHKEEKYTHSRSRSAGTASDFIQTFHNPYQQSPQQDEVLQSSRSSLSLHELNTGQSLLLTQKFVYQSPSIRHQEAIITPSINANNPFNIPTPEKEIIVSPFDDENSDDNEYIDSIQHQQKEELSPIVYQNSNVNSRVNSFSIPPPPVPSQSNKPAFPKYTRTNTFLLKRSQSTAAAKHHSHINRHQRHKSTSATENIFY